MKRLIKYFSIALIIALLASCQGLSSNLFDDSENELIQTGGATVSMFIPDYNLMANENARVVAPQTKSVKFGYKANGTFVYLPVVDLSKAEKKEYSTGNTNSIVSGYIYTLSFENIPTATYNKGDLVVQLLDASGTVLSEGTNTAEVIVTNKSTKAATFYTIPTISNAAQGALISGEMKFLKLDLLANIPYKLKLEIGASDTSYPDLVFFDANGKYFKYVSIDSAAQAEYDLGTVSQNTTYYIGIFADDNKAVSAYKLITLTDSKTVSFSEDFEGTTINSLLTGSGTLAEVTTDELSAGWVQFRKALADGHSKVYKLATMNGSHGGTSSLKIKKFTNSVESAVSFDFRTDLHNTHYLEVTVDGTAQTIYIDGVSAGKKLTGTGSIWRKASVILPAGDHEICFNAVKGSNTYYPTRKNAAYIDNITIAPNTTAMVDLSPKGTQETYVGGFNIQFTAKALRSDGSVINGKTATWTGATNGKFTPGTTADTKTVTATIDGISASNTNVVVHSANYLEDPVTIAGNTYTGVITNEAGERTNTANITWANPTPAYASFTADGFFVIKGTSTKDIYIAITKGTYKTYYFILAGNFYQRIWLRFGAGEYDVKVYEANISRNYPGNGYQGDFTSWNFNSPTTFTVTNANESLKADDARFLLPSSWCQSDNFKISNAVNAIVGELPSTATAGEKLAAIHDWEIHRMHYDNASLVSGKRKIQDAVHVLEYNLGVCEGYANLFTAMERLVGVKGTVICSSENAHAWNNTYYNGSWLLIDTTWDDPVIQGYENDNRPYDENYTYFLITAEQDKATGNNHGTYAITTNLVATGIGGTGINDMRQIDAENAPQPYVRGMPDGWY